MRPKRKKSKKEIKAEKKQKLAGRSLKSAPKAQISNIPPSAPIFLPKVVTVRDLANKLNLPVEKVISELIKNGVMANINQSIDFETAQIIGLGLGFTIKSQKLVSQNQTSKAEHLATRPPVVTIMGHIDHGKTKLLDAIRKTNLVSREAGAITQHIGAYQVTVKHKNKKRSITFLDTPGHEAFSTMRAQGVNLTDIVILVVAADDGVKPQTIEAISHARAANVPIIVAINKIDLPEADTEKVKRQLAENNLLPEEWGGKTPTLEISAKYHQNIDKLLEMILLVADMENLKADPKGLAQGVVIESKILKGFGPVAGVLVQRGELNIGDIITIGSTWAKIKTLIDGNGKRIENALPSTPVQISGLRALPGVGEVFIEQKDEKTARRAVAQTKKALVIKSIKQPEKKSEAVIAKLILKADVAGSLKAIQDKIKEIDNPHIKIEIVSQAVGAVNETDINLASAADALILSFKARPSREVKKLAHEKKVKVWEFDLIYELLDFLYGYLEDKLPPEITEQPIGRGEVIKIFHQFKTQAIAGIKIKQGKLIKNYDANLLRDGEKIGRIKIGSLEIDKKPTEQAKAGQTIGGKLIKKDPFAKIKIGDIISVYQVKKKRLKLITP